MKLICTFLNFSLLDVYGVTNLMPPVKTPEWSKLKSLRDVSDMLSLPRALLLYWCRCSFSFFELCCNMRTHGKSGLVFLVILFAQPSPCLTWWKISLEWPSFKQHRLWWCLHMVDVPTEGVSVVTRSQLMMFWLLWKLVGFLFASTHLSALQCSTAPTLMLLPLCPPASSSQTGLCHVSHLKIQSLCDSMIEVEKKYNIL